MSGRGAAVLAGLVGTLLWMAPQPAGAASLDKPARQSLRPGRESLSRTCRPPPRGSHTAHFQSGSLQELGILTSKLSAEAADFPAISTVPGFTYRYDEKLQVFEPVTGPRSGRSSSSGPRPSARASSNSVFRMRTSISSSSTGRTSTISSFTLRPQRLLSDRRDSRPTGVRR